MASRCTSPSAVGAITTPSPATTWTWSPPATASGCSRGRQAQWSAPITRSPPPRRARPTSRSLPASQAGQGGFAMARRTIVLAIAFAALALVIAYVAPGNGGGAADTAFAARPPTKTPAPTNTPTPVPPGPTATATPSGSGTLPSQILNLTNWKLTLPLNSSGGLGGEAAEILQPQLNSYVNNPYFVVNGNGVQFRAPVNGATTSGSSYPRSELREMTNNGSALASWSTISGTHTMYVREAITHLPAVKNQTMAGQIHDGSTKVIDVRLSGSTLYLELADGT